MISGPGGFTQNDTGFLLLAGSATNTYAGDTTVTLGTLQMGAVNLMPNGAGTGNLTVAGTFDLNGFDQSINGLSGTGTVGNTAIGASTMIVGKNDASGTFSGVIQNTGGALNLTKVGAGTLVLNGANTYSGTTTVTAGHARGHRHDCRPCGG